MNKIESLIIGQVMKGVLNNFQNPLNRNEKFDVNKYPKVKRMNSLRSDQLFVIKENPIRFDFDKYFLLED
jgi:hypothetical protein